MQQKSAGNPDRITRPHLDKQGVELVLLLWLDLHNSLGLGAEGKVAPQGLRESLGIAPQLGCIQLRKPAKLEAPAIHGTHKRYVAFLGLELGLFIFVQVRQFSLPAHHPESASSMLHALPSMQQAMQQAREVPESLEEIADAAVRVLAIGRWAGRVILLPIATSSAEDNDSAPV